MAPNDDLLLSGGLLLGVNYWASHAGTAMWSDWREDVVAEDLRQIAGAGLRLVRLFPLWPDFQPITRLAGFAAVPVEMRLGETPLPADGPGSDGIDQVMVDRLRWTCDQAQRCHLRLIIGLVTGWMSSRLFAPPALANRDPLTDAESIRWQVRLVRRLVMELRDHPAVVAWDLGNECNCMGRADSHQAYVWTQAIAGAIRSRDTSRPVISGMHGLAVDSRQPWSIRDQAELTDILTTHPYPLFTPGVDLDPITGTRPTIHAACETRLYADIGNRPAFAEEGGTMGPMMAADDVAPAYVRTMLWNLWAAGGRGFLWWCAYDQDQLNHAPYDWNTVERQLGLWRSDRSAKPALGALSGFQDVVRAAGPDGLPPRLVDAVCVLTKDQDQWGAALNAWATARQAGFEIAFRCEDQPLPTAPLYLVPCLHGSRAISRRCWLHLLARAEAGATVWVSCDDWFPSALDEDFGVVMDARDKPGPRAWRMDGASTSQRTGPVRWSLRPTRADVLGRDADGVPVMTSVIRGSGRLVLCTAPFELERGKHSGVYDGQDDGWRVYSHLFQGALSGRAASRQLATTGLSEHPRPDGSRLVVAVNQSRGPVQERLSPQAGWRFTRILHGCGRIGADGSAELALPGNDGALLSMARSPI